ncbi:MAG: aminotransferase class IV [Candidatus Omnitrophica bacterium]|nr:aminotransferase class IV [Candidatus Omnitrophota bacterium]
MKGNWIFLDGRMIKADTALMNSLEPGVIKGKGVFETMRVRGAEIENLKEHLGRLDRGLTFFKMRSPYAQEKLKFCLTHTLKANHLQGARVRLAVWRERRRLRMAIVCRRFEGYPRDKYRKGFNAVVSDIRRLKTRDFHIKSLNYRCFREAFIKAKAAGYDEAVLLNSRGKIIEGSRTNIFFVQKGTLYTPAVKEGCLNGITRQQVIQYARKAKIPFRAVAADVRRLFHADEAFVTNSLMGIMPLTSVGKRRIGAGSPGPVTRKLLDMYCRKSHSSCPVCDKSV